MRNKIKILVLIFIVILLSGCSGNYNLKINNDLSVDENLELVMDNEGDTYFRTLKIFEDNNISNDKYGVVVSGDEVKVTYNDSFDSVEEYILKSKVYNQLFEKIEFNRSNKYLDLYAKERLKVNNNYTSYNGSNLNDFNVIQVNITNPYKVLITNADIVNDNVYTWSLTKEDIDKKIHMQFKTSLNKISIRPIIVGILLLIIVLIFAYRLYNKFKKSRRI